MKKIFILFIGLYLSFTGLSQPCLPDGIYFGSQTTIDNFQTNYPNCTQIQGWVTINGSDITNLNGLSVVTSIGGYFNCSNNALTNLSGLNSVTFIGGDVYFQYNPELINLSGLDNLTSIAGELYFLGNYTLTSLTGLESLTSIGGSLTFSHNQALINLLGLNSLSSIGEHFNIIDNPALTNLTGLDSLTSIGSWLNITGNIALISLTGLDNLTYIGADLVIEYDSILTNCAIQSICNYLANPSGNIIIYENATGCNSIQEVMDSCGITSIANLYERPVFLLYPNPASTTITIETTTKGSLSIHNINGQQLLQKEITEASSTIDVSTLLSGIYVVKVVGEKEVQVGKFVKR